MIVRKHEFYDLVLKRRSTQDVSRAAHVLQTLRLNLVPLKELAMRTVVSNLPKLSEQIDHLPKTAKTLILETIAKSICRQFYNHLRRQVISLIEPNPDGTCSLKTIPRVSYQGMPIQRKTRGDRESLLLDLSNVKRLITSDLEEFNLNVIKGDLTDFSEEEIWKCLASSAPNLKILRDYGRDSDTKPVKLILKYLVRFADLSDLELSTFYFCDDDVRVLSESCRKLKSIHLPARGGLTSAGLKFLTSLPLLEKVSLADFQGCLVGKIQDSADAQMVFEMLPNLKHIFENVGLTHDSSVHLNIPNELPCSYKLQQLLRFGGCVGKIPSHLTELEAISSTFDLAPEIFEQLPKLRVLHYPYFPKDYATLGLIGSRLVEISAGQFDNFHEGLYGMENVDLGQILVSCPNLQKLHLLASVFEPTDLMDSVDPGRLKLRDLKLTQMDYFKDREPYARMAVWEVLLAPELHSVGLFNFLFSEPRALLDPAEPVLQNLTTLGTSFEFEWPRKEDKVWSQLLDAHNKLLAGLIKNCPRLETVHCEVFAENRENTDEHATLLFAKVSPEWCRIPKEVDSPLKSVKGRNNFKIFRFFKNMFGHKN
ncbi:uncharacterized protein LOC132195799 [Neocloeon triangulifer]|uniref:uncharacterized protein LOC132195799 n=1 Tax=Neocloeon triangulifer TaxID=2078957 RepID=UPI00286F27FE|nr:uncharacterized protein LOC132195799 [Neocloeon triangulifer]XP_059473992.1 uncharacterized protein LOC132195799 [Neocloeon triangulifer]XP_059473993.1 uncharacterized protein LOC132195799 [Neocloeon triangulifer]